MCSDPWKFLYRIFEASEIFYWSTFGGPTSENRQKNRFFQMFSKFDLNEFRYLFRVQNNSKTLQKPISGHISSFWPISAAVSKIEFLAKIAIFAIFTYFWLLTIWPTIWPEMLKNAIRGRKWPLRAPKTCLHTLGWPLMMIWPQGKIGQKTWFFMIFF